MNGLLIAGIVVPVPGVTIIGPHDATWAHLSPGDGVARSRWPQFGILHKTKADDPERVLSSPGPRGMAERVAKFWQDDPAHSGAHLVASDDLVACLADLVSFEAWHGNQSNLRSFGMEMYEEMGGIVREGTLANAMRVVLAAAEHLGIQLQVPRPGTYRGPMKRFEDGGATLVGFFGHRDVTPTRGRWDPGEAIWARLISAGAEAFDFDAGEDLAVWKQRQRDLNDRGHHLLVDGIPGPATTAALADEGYRGGVFALGKRLPITPHCDGGGSAST